MKTNILHKGNLIPFIVALATLSVGGLSTWLWKLDNRQFDMTSDFASKAEMKDAIDGLRINFDSKFTSLEKVLNERREDRRIFDEKILSAIAETNKSVQQLAVKLEERTN